ncbi:hypothetical protein EG343_09945 [Chryseobacterium nakagawai]|uniref:Uncharacterized protein n=2 Tax=Chryseobacterium nakagawai TaxID=1241982 RepID=A0AAD1DRI7_CHRNA|nr:hypothetical protein EG343_09945 [Chryseobacterium nakagawai]
MTRVFGVYLFRKNSIFILVFCWFGVSAQINPSRSNGEVFKHRPDNPYENVDYSGLVVVKKAMYGLTFEDKELSSEVKKRVERFFKRRLNGYTELKTYQLRINKKRGKWYVDNVEI